MVRNYTKKSNRSSRNEENLKNALEQVKSNAMSVNHFETGDVHVRQILFCIGRRVFSALFNSKSRKKRKKLQIKKNPVSKWLRKPPTFIPFQEPL